MRSSTRRRNLDSRDILRQSMEQRVQAEAQQAEQGKSEVGRYPRYFFHIGCWRERWRRIQVRHGLRRWEGVHDARFTPLLRFDVGAELVVWADSQEGDVG